MPLLDTILRKYPNRYFVETGTFMGEGVQYALKAAFPNIISLELGEDLARNAQQLFQQNNNVKIIQGDVQYILWDAIKDIQEPITFWLDGHYSGGPTVKSDIPDPIIRELRIIERHPVKTHTILVDDIRLYKENGWPWTDGSVPITLEEIRSALKVINPDYKYSLEDGYVKEDILVAHL